jgi:hypothetical protein
MAKIVSFILSDELAGKGIEGDPYRRVTQLWTFGGALVASSDPYLREKGGARESFFDPNRAPLNTHNDHKEG